MTLAERLADYAGTVSFHRLPSEVVHEVKRRLLDSVGCALGAWSAAPCRIARNMGTRVNVADGATIWGTASKTLPDLAAFANGALVRYLDFNDTYLSKEPAHPSDNIAPVLAVGETVHASGRRVIEAIVLAYEIQCRLCDAAALRPRGWDHVTYGPFSSALGAAKLLRLSQMATTQAVNLAGVANVALRQTRVGEVSMWKACAFSNAARNGVFAALLAGEGMTGPAPIFEGEKGFMKLVSGSLELPSLGGESVRAQVPFKIMDTYIKHYPVEYHAQTAVEAALPLREQLLRAEGREFVQAIQEIEVGSYDVAIEIIGRDPEKWRPQTRETADHSFPYCIAVALVYGDVTSQSFSARRLNDPVLRALMGKVHVVEVDEFRGRYPHTMPTRLMVRMAGGRQYTVEIDVPLGHPRRPMPDVDIVHKVRRLSAGRLKESRLERFVEAVWKLETVKDVGTLMPWLKL